MTVALSDASGSRRRSSRGKGHPRAGRLAAILAASTLAVCATALADDVRVGLDWPGGRPASSEARVTIRATPRASLAPSAALRDLSTLAPAAGAVLDLAAGAWTLSAAADGYWSTPLEIDVGGGATPSPRIALWPAATIGGELSPSAADALPETVDLLLNPSEAGGKPAGARFSEGLAVRCPVTDGRWSCSVPAGVFDLELRPGDYVPSYGWAVSLSPGGATRLRRTALRRGASLAGRLQRTDGSVPAGPCKVAISVDAPRQREPAGGAAREGPSVFAVSPNGRGFFQIIGLPAGEHELTAECFAARASQTVSVVPDAETRLDRPLVLEELVLDVSVTPRVDPDGRPWRLNVYSTAPRWRRVAGQAVASPEGRWSKRGLTSGSYQVEVVSEDGRQWVRREVQLAGRSALVGLRVPLVAVAGQVQLTTQPLRARLEFSNEVGGEPIRLETDDDGRFNGYFPLAPGPSSRRWVVEVHAKSPPINRRLEGLAIPESPGEATSWLELTLPVVALRGVVVSEDRQPQAAALVGCESVATGIGTTVMADADGSFELVDLEQGAYRIVAESPVGFSEPVLVELTEGAEQELELVLQQPRRFSGLVTSAGGPVAAAALQIWLAPGVPRTFVTTDAEGRFDASLPPEAGEVGVTVHAPGHALKMARLPISDGNPVTIELTEVAGSLVVALPPASLSQGATGAVVAHDGAIESVETLGRLGRMDGGETTDRRIEIPRVEVGVYTLCRVSSGDFSTVWSGTIAREHCAVGSLAPGDVLRLSLPTGGGY